MEDGEAVVMEGKVKALSLFLHSYLGFMLAFP